MPNKRFEADRSNRCALCPAARARRWAACFAGLALLLATEGRTATESHCTMPSLADHEVLRIVETDLANRGLNFVREKWEYGIGRRECNYVFFAKYIPATPGGHFQYEISEEGEILVYIPGM